MVMHVRGEEGRLSSRTVMGEGYVCPRGAVVSHLRVEGAPCICVHIEGAPHPTHG